MLSDGDFEKTTKVPMPAPGSPSWVQYEFPSPHVIRAITYVTRDPGLFQALAAKAGAPEKTLEASDDGKTFRKVSSLNGGAAPVHTLSFEPVEAKYFRVTFTSSPPPPVPLWAEGVDPASFGGRASGPPTFYEVAELALHSDARVSHFAEKAAFVPEGDLLPVRHSGGRSLARDPEVGRRRSDVEDGPRRHAPLDAAGGPVGGPAHRIFAPGDHQSPRDSRGHRAGGGQARSALREGLLRQVPRQLQGDGGGRRDGREGHPVRDQRQLGGRIAELDRRHAGAVQEGYAATTRRPGCRC